MTKTFSLSTLTLKIRTTTHLRTSLTSHPMQDNNGPLGLLKEGNGHKTPQQVLADVPVVKVSSGNNHLALLAQDGRVFTCGCGEAGQLGRIAEVFANRSSRNRNGIRKCFDQPCPERKCTWMTQTCIGIPL